MGCTEFSFVVVIALCEQPFTKAIDLPLGCVALGDMAPLWGGDMWAVGLVGDSGPRGEVGVEGGDIVEFVLAPRGESSI